MQNLTCARWDGKLPARFLLIDDQEWMPILEHLLKCGFCFNRWQTAIDRGFCLYWKMRSNRFLTGEMDADFQNEEFIFTHVDRCAYCKFYWLVNIEQSKSKRILPIAPVKPIKTRLPVHKHFLLAASVFIACLLIMGFWALNKHSLVSSNDEKAFYSQRLEYIENLMRNYQDDQAEVELGEIAPGFTINNQNARPEVLYLYGRLAGNRGNHDLCAKLCKEAILRADPADYNFLVKPYIILANLAHLHDQTDEAIHNSTIALDYAVKINNAYYQAIMLEVKGISEIKQARYDDGETDILTAINIARIEHKDRALVQGYIYLALLRAEEKKFNEVESLFQDSINIISAVDNKLMRTEIGLQVYGYQARCFAIQGRYTEAIERYQLALSEENKLNTHSHITISQFQQGLAECYRAIGNEKLAEIAEIKAEAQEDVASEHCEEWSQFLSFAPTRKPNKHCQ